MIIRYGLSGSVETDRFNNQSAATIANDDGLQSIFGHDPENVNFYVDGRQVEASTIVRDGSTLTLEAKASKKA